MATKLVLKEQYNYTDNEIEEARRYYETDYDKWFYELSISEQLDYLYKARLNLKRSN